MCASFRYQAQSWEKSRRVVAHQVESHPGNPGLTCHEVVSLVMV